MDIWRALHLTVNWYTEQCLQAHTHSSRILRVKWVNCKETLTYVCQRLDTVLVYLVNNPLAANGSSQWQLAVRWHVDVPVNGKVRLHNPRKLDGLHWTAFLLGQEVGKADTMLVLSDFSKPSNLGCAADVHKTRKAFQSNNHRNNIWPWNRAVISKSQGSLCLWTTQLVNEPFVQIMNSTARSHGKSEGININENTWLKQ